MKRQNHNKCVSKKINENNYFNGKFGVNNNGKRNYM